MNEQTRPPSEQSQNARGLGSIFADDDDSGRLVTVTSGPYAEQLPVGNMTVGQIRTSFRDRFDIDPRSQAVIDGNDVGDDVVVRPGQVLVFSRRAGEKGKAI